MGTLPWWFLYLKCIYSQQPCVSQCQLNSDGIFLIFSPVTTRDTAVSRPCLLILPRELSVLPVQCISCVQEFGAFVTLSQWTSVGPDLKVKQMWPWVGCGAMCVILGNGAVGLGSTVWQTAVLEELFFSCLLRALNKFLSLRLSVLRSKSVPEPWSSPSLKGGLCSAMETSASAACHQI